MPPLKKLSSAPRIGFHLKAQNKVVTNCDLAKEISNTLEIYLLKREVPI